MRAHDEDRWGQSHVIHRVPCVLGGVRVDRVHPEIHVAEVSQLPITFLKVNMINMNGVLILYCKATLENFN